MLFARHAAGMKLGCNSTISSNFYVRSPLNLLTISLRAINSTLLQIYTNITHSFNNLLKSLLVYVCIIWHHQAYMHHTSIWFKAHRKQVVSQYYRLWNQYIKLIQRTCYVCFHNIVLQHTLVWHNWCNLQGGFALWCIKPAKWEYHGTN